MEENLPSVIESPKQTTPLIGVEDTISILEMKYQWGTLYSSENYSSFILLPFSIKEFVIEYICPVISEGTLPKNIDMTTSEHMGKL